MYLNCFFFLLTARMPELRRRMKQQRSQGLGVANEGDRGESASNTFNKDLH
jgi:hypothetical protein